jgi:hypothetical protein
MGREGFSPQEARLLEGVLDQLIPPSADGRLPGAGQVRLVDAIEKSLRAAPGMRPVVEGGLATLAELVRGRGKAGFEEMSAPERAAAMKELESRDLGFFMTLMLLAYPAYYQQAQVLEALGMEARPPHPKGYTMKPHDLTLLDPVRRRPKMFRWAE